MDIAYLQLLLDYHYWARDRMLAAVAALTKDEYERDLGNSFPSVRDTVNHIYLAEWVWHTRWLGASPNTFPPKDELPDLATLRARWAEREPAVRSFVASLSNAGIERSYEYKLFSGAAGTSRFWEMLVHVVNHATYHRGQVTTLLRQLGAKPPESMDMIAFFRARAAGTA